MVIDNAVPEQFGTINAIYGHHVVSGFATLHRSRGFREVGTFRNYAEKSGRVLSSTWFQLEL